MPAPARRLLRWTLPLVALAAAPRVHSQAGPSAAAVVRFTVVDSASGAPLRDASLAVMRVRGRIRTDSLGRVVVRGALASPGRARVERLGYFDREVRWDPARDSVEVRVELVPTTIALSEVRVVAERLDAVVSGSGNAVRTIGSDVISSTRATDALGLIQDQTSLQPVRCRTIDAMRPPGRGCFYVRGHSTRACVVVDEAPALGGLEDLTGVVTDDIGRIYVLHGGSMVALYTRGFLKETAARGRSLRNIDVLSNAFCTRS